MTSFNRKAHWENVYQTKELTQVSWYEPTPHTPLDFIKKHFLDKNTAIIDIGGGDSSWQITCSRMVIQILPC